ALLSSIISHPCLLDTCSAVLTLESFSNPNNAIFESLRAMWDAKVPIDLVSLTDFMEKRGLLGKVGGAYGLTEITNSSNTPANADYYIQLLRVKQAKREIMLEADRVKLDITALETPDQISELISTAFEKQALLCCSADDISDKKLLKDYISEVEE